MAHLIGNNRDLLFPTFFIAGDIILLIISIISIIFKEKLFTQQILTIKSNKWFKWNIFIQFLFCTIYCTFSLISLLQSEWDTVNKFKDIMKNTMAFYPEGSNKNVLDRIQMKYRCCGLHSYEDWYQYPWYSKKLTQTNLINDDIPFSCCSDEIVVPCIHHGLKSKVYFNQYNFEKLAIWKVGCTKKYSETYEKDLFYIYFTSILIPILFSSQNLIDRLLQTADSTYCENEQCVGWIFRKGNIPLRS